MIVRSRAAERPYRRRLTAWIALAAFAVFPAAVGPAAAAQSALPPLEHLTPGESADLVDAMPVNHVFLGYEAEQVSEQEYRAQLPERYQPIERVANTLHGITNYVGITHVFDHRVTFAGDEYEDRFFAMLASIAVPRALTTSQSQYNDQEARVLTVEDNHQIHGPAVEQWLAHNPPPGVDTRDHTVFFINWHGREDFRFHVYDKTGEPETDFGRDWGARDTDMGIAWGGSSANDPETGLGSTHRIWFHDLSAGPEHTTRNYDVTNRDLDLDGREDYRMPPVWEYTAGGYRRPSALSHDLARIARYVAIDLLFTPSPLYPPDVKAPRLATTVNLDLNFYDTPAQDTSDKWVTEEEITRTIDALLPDRDVTVDKQDLDLGAADHARCFAGFAFLYGIGPGCYHPEHPSYRGSANLFVHNVKRLGDQFDDVDAAGYEAGAFNYWLPDGTVQAVGGPGCWAWADHNYRDGTQSFVYMILTPLCTHGNNGGGHLGYTDILIHEYGHHFGVSHPHDGFDSEENDDFSAYDDAFFFAWVGDEVNSVMSYKRYNNDFSQFDLDNMTRWMTAGYITAVNDIAGAPLDGDALDAADELVGSAIAAFSSQAYDEALRNAIEAHSILLGDVDRAGIRLDERWTGHTLVDDGAVPDVLGVTRTPGAYMFVDDLTEMYR